VLTFFERSPLDQVLKNDNVHKIQPSFQSPVKISGTSSSEDLGWEEYCCRLLWCSLRSFLICWVVTGHSLGSRKKIYQNCENSG
jgi:hypothetical protein